MPITTNPPTRSGFATEDLAAEAAGALLKREAFDLIRSHPERHLALTIPFLWRGAFLAFAICLAARAHSVRRRQPMPALFVLPAFGMVMFYGLFSRFIQWRSRR